MKISKLIEELQKIKDKDRELQILIGNEYNDSLGCDNFELMHTDNHGIEHCVEIFCHEDNCYTHPFPQSNITILNDILKGDE
jgi:hypothetical protein